jgi:hypothetical protein
MVKNFIQQIFHTSESIRYSGLPDFSLLLPPADSALYFDYYQAHGAGFVVLLGLLFVTIFELCFSELWQRRLAKLIIFLLALTWSTGDYYDFKLLSFPQNALLLPIPRISPEIVLVTIGLLFIPLLISFANRLQSQLSGGSWRVVKLFSLIMAVILFLPWLT